MRKLTFSPTRSLIAQHRPIRRRHAMNACSLFRRRFFPRFIRQTIWHHFNRVYLRFHCFWASHFCSFAGDACVNDSRERHCEWEAVEKFSRQCNSMCSSREWRIQLVSVADISYFRVFSFCFVLVPFLFSFLFLFVKLACFLKFIAELLYRSSLPNYEFHVFTYLMGQWPGVVFVSVVSATGIRFSYPHILCVRLFSSSTDAMSGRFNTKIAKVLSFVTKNKYPDKCIMYSQHTDTRGERVECTSI